LYHENGKDSILYSQDLAKSYIYYKVFDNRLLVSLGNVNREPTDLNMLISNYRVFFDKSGLPYKSSYFHYSSTEPFISEIKIETY